MLRAISLTTRLTSFFAFVIYSSTTWAVLPTGVSALLTLSENPQNYIQNNFPPHFNPALQALDNTPSIPVPTNNMATLGRVLFFDKQLSANNTKACASCHIQANGFSDPDQFSEGFAGRRTERNSMGLTNARFYENGHFFWDERANTLAAQTLQPIQNDIEMGLSLAQAVAKISSRSYSDYLFQEAFGSTIVTSDRIASALSQYVRSIVSFQTPYDAGLATVGGNPNNNFSNYSTIENAGKNLFFSGRTQCANCHVNGRNGNRAVFQPNQPRNNGLDLVSVDAGEGGVNGNNNDVAKFKVPSLRNIALTAPYMHDGRFTSLEQVVEHYNSGVQNHPNLDRRLRVGGGQVRRLNLNNNEKASLVAFMHTLTDSSLINDSRFSDPFRNSSINVGNSGTGTRAIGGILMLLLDD